jgi:hypothetical protein
LLDREARPVLRQELVDALNREPDRATTPNVTGDPDLRPRLAIAQLKRDGLIHAVQIGFTHYWVSNRFAVPDHEWQARAKDTARFESLPQMLSRPTPPQAHVVVIETSDGSPFVPAERPKLVMNNQGVRAHEDWLGQ